MGRVFDDLIRAVRLFDRLRDHGVLIVSQVVVGLALLFPPNLDDADF
jgi:hypothetical protein